MLSVDRARPSMWNFKSTPIPETYFILLRPIHKVNAVKSFWNARHYNRIDYTHLHRLKIFINCMFWERRGSWFLRNRIQWERVFAERERGRFRSSFSEAERGTFFWSSTSGTKTESGSSILDSSPFHLTFPASMPGVNNIIVTIIARGNPNIYFWMWWFE